MLPSNATVVGGTLELFATLGKFAGLAGLALGVFLLIFRDIIRRELFQNVSSEDTYKLFRLLVICTWTVTLVGMLLWAAPGLTIVVGDNNQIRH